jgi:hypothetical protein
MYSTGCLAASLRSGWTWIGCSLIGKQAVAEDNDVGNPSNSAQFDDGDIPSSSRQHGRDSSGKAIPSHSCISLNRNNIGEPWWWSVPDNQNSVVFCCGEWWDSPDTKNVVQTLV